MIQALRFLIEFCYTVHRNIHTTATLEDLEKILEDLQDAREIFLETGVRELESEPPRQHFLVHYPHLIREFGAPNGLDSSITESKHIKSVKEPWRRSNRWKALGQMLVTNQRLDKLTKSEAIFKSKQMLEGEILPDIVTQCEY